MKHNAGILFPPPCHIAIELSPARQSSKVAFVWVTFYLEILPRLLDTWAKLFGAELHVPTAYPRGNAWNQINNCFLHILHHRWSMTETPTLVLPSSSCILSSTDPHMEMGEEGEGGSRKTQRNCISRVGWRLLGETESESKHLSLHSVKWTSGTVNQLSSFPSCFNLLMWHTYKLKDGHTEMFLAKLCYLKECPGLVSLWLKRHLSQTTIPNR